MLHRNTPKRQFKYRSARIRTYCVKFSKKRIVFDEVVHTARIINTACAFLAPDPWAGNPMIAFLWGTAQMPQDAHVTSSRTVAGHTATKRPAGVLTGFLVPSGSRVATGPTPRSARASAWVNESADRLIVNPSWFAARITPALWGKEAS